MADSRCARDVLDEVARGLRQQDNQYTGRNVDWLRTIGDMVAGVMLTPVQERFVRNCAVRIPSGACPDGYTEFVMILTTCIQSFRTAALEQRLCELERQVSKIDGRTMGSFRVGNGG